MPMRTTRFSRFPWTGGINTSVDPALIDPNELTIGSNIIFSTQGTRRKRDGLNYDWDNLAITSASRASVGLTRTLTTTGYIWKVGETFQVSGLPSAYNTSLGVVTSTDSTVKSTVTFTVASPGKVNWTSHGLTVNTAVAFRNAGGALPAGMVADKVYFVRNPTANQFELALEPNGASLAAADAGTGTHTARKYLEDIITYTASTNLTESATADLTGVFTLTNPVIAQHDYWYDNGVDKTHKLVAFTSQGRLFEIDLNTGGRTLIYETGTPYTDLPLTRASMVTYDNRLILCTEGQSNIPKYVFPTSLGGGGVLADIVNEAGYAPTPNADICQVHIGRLWFNDKTNFDRLHYNETGTYNLWQGAGDSGALDVTPGDGDPDGITAIFPPFKGNLIIAKRTKLYRVDGQTPEEFTLTTMSTGIGCVGQGAVAGVDQDDVIFVSDRGIHSLSATANYGAFAGSYLSAAIQGSINEFWSRSEQYRIQAVYVDTLNSVAFTVSEGDTGFMNNIWFYNVPLKAWYKWSNIDCESLCNVTDTDQKRLYIGSRYSRIGKTFSGFNYDVAQDGTQSAVTMSIKTGRIFPDGSPTTVKAFKQFSLIYKPSGTYNITATIKIDNFSSQALLFSDTSGTDVLDLNFILGQSVLGGDRVAQAFTQTLDGYGRGFTLTVEQAGLNEFGEIIGFEVAYEPAEWPQETRAGDET